MKFPLLNQFIRSPLQPEITHASSASTPVFLLPKYYYTHRHSISCTHAQTEHKLHTRLPTRTHTLPHTHTHTHIHTHTYTHTDRKNSSIICSIEFWKSVKGVGMLHVLILEALRGASLGRPVRPALASWRRMGGSAGSGSGGVEDIIETDGNADDCNCGSKPKFFTFLRVILTELEFIINSAVSSEAHAFSKKL